MPLYDGRGRWYRWQKRATVDDYLALDVQKIGREHGFDRYRVLTWRWTWSTLLGGEHSARIELMLYDDPPAATLRYTWEGKEHEQHVAVRRLDYHTHGHRLDWLCPHCGRPARYLYGAPFACRKCHNLAYPSQQASKHEAVIHPVRRRLATVRRALGVVGDARPREKPAGMHWRRWLALRDEWYALRELEDTWLLRGMYGCMGDEMWAQLSMERAEVLPHLKPAEEMRRYRARRAAGKYHPEPWLLAFYRRRPRRAAPAAPLTLGKLATAAGVSHDCAREARRAGLLRPDNGRRYRPKLAGWLAKLGRLRAEGMTWPEIRAWTRRRWLPGHEHERREPARNA